MKDKHGHDRRSFVTRLAAFASLPALGAASTYEEAAAAPWDLAWLDSLTGKHKQVFDFGSMDFADRDIVAGDSQLRVPRNYLNAHKEVYGLEPPAINTIIGIASSGFPINANDAIWAKYSLGQRWKIKDSTTGTWAVRNLFADATKPLDDRGITVQALQKRGTIFWQCNNALNGLVQRLAGEMKMDPTLVRADLVAGLLPGVKLVPAHTMALGLVQERGCTYEKV